MLCYAIMLSTVLLPIDSIVRPANECQSDLDGFVASADHYTDQRLWPWSPVTDYNRQQRKELVALAEQRKRREYRTKQQQRWNYCHQ